MLSFIIGLNQFSGSHEFGIVEPLLSGVLFVLRPPGAPPSVCWPAILPGMKLRLTC